MAARATGRLARWLRRFVLLCAGCVILALGGVAALWFHLRANLPLYEGTRPLPVLAGPVSVWRTAEAIPVIEAESWPDAWRTLGYLHAEDRLFQMELTRLVGGGRLAELIGAPAIDSDRLMRILGFNRAVEADYAALAPETRAALDAYAEGVNAWLEEPPGPLPIEFQLLMHRPARWRPQDSLFWGKLMAWQLSGNMRGEVERAALIARLGARAGDFERMIGDAPVTLPDPPGSAEPPATAETPPAGPDWPAVLAAMTGPSSPDRASNMFIVAGARSATGHPILANDPHLGVSAPILWYPARFVVAGSGRLTGVTVPGVPFVVLGQSETTAWGMTTTGADTQDLVVETPDPADPSRVLTPAGSAPVETREETIQVRFGRDVTMRVRRTPSGPVISDLRPSFGAALGDGRMLALDWSFLRGTDGSADALLGMNTAADWPSFRAAARRLAGPQQNIGYADAAGTIALIAPARLPLRAAGRDGRLPVDGRTAAPGGLVAPERIPELVNPPGGVITTANNPLVGPNHPFLKGEWAPGWRESRQAALLKPITALTLDQATGIQTDRMAPESAVLLPLMLTARAAAGGGDAARLRALDLLAAWGGQMRRDRAEPLIYQAWLWQLQNRLIRKPLGPLGAARMVVESDRLIDILSRRPERCDDPATTAAEDCPRLLADTLGLALAAIEKVQGPEPGQWRWGPSHPAMFRHILFGRIPGLTGLFGRRIETGGGPTALDRGDLGAVRADGALWENGHAAGYRAVYDLADPGRSRVIVSTGVSGNPLSPWYDNLIVLWRNGGYVVLPTGRDALRRQGIGRLRLLPPAKDTP